MTEAPCRCPSCRQAMTSQRFPAKLMGEVQIDICFHCQGLWFDSHESLQIAPGAIVDLFREIHQHRDDPRQPLAETLYCPRCNDRLLHGMDRVPSGQFNYDRCLQGHGRFITFGQFMIEKGFVRQLTPMEVDDLAAKVGVVRCLSCGTPVDIRSERACSHCRSPISILDPEAATQALARYQQAEVKRTTPNVDALADAILARERANSYAARSANQEAQSDIADLLTEGISFIAEVFSGD